MHTACRLQTSASWSVASCTETSDKQPSPPSPERAPFRQRPAIGEGSRFHVFRRAISPIALDTNPPVPLSSGMLPLVRVIEKARPTFFPHHLSAPRVFLLSGQRFHARRENE